MLSIDRLPRVLDRLSRIGVEDDCPPEETLERQVLTLVAVAVGFLAFLWSVSYLVIGRPWAALIPGAYAVVTLFTSLRLNRTKSFAGFKAAQITLLLPLPFMLQWVLGGFASSGTVAVWAVVPAALAVAFGFRHRLMFGAFLALLLVSALVDQFLQGAIEPLDPMVSLAFFTANLAGTAASVFAGLAWFTAERRRMQGAVEAARARSDQLLLNILPSSIADRLKDGERTIADRLPAVSVLFADIVGFTTMSRDTDAVEVVEDLDSIFSAMDDIASDLGLEKLKTIGDGYQLVGGAPVATHDHADAAAEAALRFMEQIRGMPFGEFEVDLRIGLDTGPVIAAVVGKTKFAYDVWGEAVNLASRMESHGVPGRVQVTGRFKEAVTGPYRFVPREMIDVKSFGEAETFFLERP